MADDGENEDDDEGGDGEDEDDGNDGEHEGDGGNEDKDEDEGVGAGVGDCCMVKGVVCEDNDAVADAGDIADEDAELDEVAIGESTIEGVGVAEDSSEESIEVILNFADGINASPPPGLNAWSTK